MKYQELMDTLYTIALAGEQLSEQIDDLANGEKFQRVGLLRRVEATLVSIKCMINMVEGNLEESRNSVV